jgi:hypothetical protein
MACWRSETTKRSHENLKCGLKELPGIANPAVDIVAGLAFAAVEIANAQTDLRTAGASISEAQSILKGVKELTPGCVSAVAAVGADFASVSNRAVGLVDKVTRAKGDSDRGELNTALIVDLMTGITDVIGTTTKLTITLGTLNGCVKAGEAAKAVSTLQRATAAVKRLEKTFKGLKPANKLDAALKLGKCGVSVVRGLYALGNNTVCLGRDLAALYESDKAVARALAYVGSRQFNNAKFIGCRDCVRDTGVLTATGDVDLRPGTSTSTTAAPAATTAARGPSRRATSSVKTGSRAASSRAPSSVKRISRAPR